MRGAGLAIGSLLLLAANDASAEMYKCRGPNGHTLYTSDASQCPGAPKHEPRGSVQAIDAPSRPGPEGGPARISSQPSAPAPPGDADAARAASWRRKKALAQSELARLADLVPNLERSVTWCNRGGELYEQDEFGMRRTIPCERVRSELDSAETELARLRTYLDGGLEEQCRRAGCLPGWIR